MNFFTEATAPRCIDAVQCTGAEGTDRRTGGGTRSASRARPGLGPANLANGSTKWRRDEKGTWRSARTVERGAGRDGGREDAASLGLDPSRFRPAGMPRNSAREGGGYKRGVSRGLALWAPQGLSPLLPPRRRPIVARVCVCVCALRVLLLSPRCAMPTVAFEPRAGSSTRIRRYAARVYVRMYIRLRIEILINRASTLRMADDRASLVRSKIASARHRGTGSWSRIFAFNAKYGSPEIIKRALFSHSRY